MLKLALAQINPTIGDVEGNLALIQDATLEASKANADLVVFPELALTGYYPADLLDDAEFKDRVLKGYADLLTFSRKLNSDITLVVGLPLRVKAGTGKPWTNSLLVLQRGKVQLEYSKQLLPTYDVFDERRHFEPGPDTAAVLNLRGVRLGFIICEDGWNLDGKAYAIDPFTRLQSAAVDLVVSINASPSSAGKQAQREALFSQACRQNGFSLVYVNQVGGQDSLVYDGHSFAASPTRGVVHRAKGFESDLAFVTFDKQERQFSGAFSEVSVPSSDVEVYRQQIVLGLRDYARRCGFTKAVVGSSGGIDSALTLALAVQALGAENVTAIGMPSDISSPASLSDSLELCANLGIEHRTFHIAGLVRRYIATSTLDLRYVPQGLALENLQARIRGMVLMTHSNMYGHLVLTTGNKSELSVGYSTLYGDMSGGLGLIGDLYKTEVYALARHLNATAGRELIPQNILDKEPSAELAPGQKDSDSLPAYDVLDVILKKLIEGNSLPAEELHIVQQAYAQLEAVHPEVILRVKTLIARSEYKRRQAAPILKLRSRSFGAGRQIPITAKQY